MDKSIKNYLSKIGQKGGKKSRRKLSTEQSLNMIKVREARRAYKEFYDSCFWSFKKDLVIKSSDVRWVAEQLKKNGNRKAWLKAKKLCL